MIAQFADILNRLGMEPTGREIAEMLFLAIRIAPNAADATAKGQDLAHESAQAKPSPESITPQTQTSSNAQQAQPETARQPKPGELYLNQPKTGASGGASASGVRVASAIALPGARGIARALRPLMRVHPSRTRQELDLDRTIEATAETGVSMIVRKPAPERWLEAALVVDEGETMRVWRPTIREFQRLLERHGAFRNVRVWGMNADDGTPGFYRGIGRVAPPARLRDPRELLDAEGRCLIFVLSDCHSAGWHSRGAFELLSKWGEYAPVVLAQLLPQRLWEPTAMPRIDSRLSAVTPGLPNAKLQHNSPSAANRGATPMPVVMLEEWAISPWAQMIAARGAASAKGFLIPCEWPQTTLDPEELRSDQQTPQMSGEVPEIDEARRRIAEFKAAASIQSFRLACFLAAVELSFPVMRLVQQAMMPESRQSHLAEVFLGGLIRPIGNSAETAGSPDDILYEFYPGVRELLLAPEENHNDPRETLRVVAEISRLIENRLPFASEFRVLLAHPGAQGEEQITPGRSAFATISPIVLQRFFGVTDTLKSQEQPPEQVKIEDSFDFVLGDVDSQLARGETEKALNQIDAARNLAGRAAKSPWQAEAYARLADAYFRAGHFENAIECATTARNITQDRATAASMLDLLGRVWVSLGDKGDLSSRTQGYSTAESYFLQSLDIRRELKDQRSVCDTLVYYGHLLQKTDRSKDAERAYEEALIGYRRIKHREGEASAIGALGNLYHKLDQHRRAIELHNESREIWSELGNRYAVARVTEELSLDHHALGRKSEAIRLARAAIDLFRQLESPQNESIDLLQRRLEQWQAIQLAPFTFETVTLDARGKIIKDGRRTISTRHFIEELDKEIRLEMVEIPGGKFMMGSPESEAERRDDEGPQHEVTISPFFMGKFTITQAQWRVVAGWDKIASDLKPDPSYFKDRKDSDDRPVEQISWEDAQEFCARLEARTGRAYRLPTEAEWEYACRAGTTTPFAFGETITHGIVNYWSEYPYAKASKKKQRGETVPVGSLGVANAFGLYDMHGNVWEWCQDRYGPYTNKPQTDPTGPKKGENQVLRGGSYGSSARYCRSACRSHDGARVIDSDFGLRVCISARVL